MRSRFLSLKQNVKFIFAVEQLSFILEKEKVKTIIKIEDHENEILPRLKNIPLLEDRVSYFLKLEREQERETERKWGRERVN